MFVLGLLGIVIVLTTLWDGFETIVMTRSVSQNWRLTKVFYFLVRRQYYSLTAKVKQERWRNTLLMVYPPLSLMVLFSLWGGFIILGFALVNYGFNAQHTSGSLDPFSAWYYSGVTFLTLGFGDIAPVGTLSRILAVAEAATGLVFLASVISYLPVMYGVVQKREYLIVMLDSKAGSDPSGFELLRRHAEAGTMHMLPDLLEKYEHWGAEMLEAYLSYPLIAFYRSQHDTQNWIKTSVAIMDACAIIEACTEVTDESSRQLKFQARATFASLRHVVVDLAYIIGMPPKDDCTFRLSPEDFQIILKELNSHVPRFAGDFQALCAIRYLYEPYCVALGEGLLMDLPKWRHAVRQRDNWEVAAWDGAQHNDEP
jgi:Ion channel